MGETHHIIRDVVFEKTNFHAVLLQRESFSIFSEFYFERGWEVGHIAQPCWKTLTAVFSAVEIVMSIDNNANPIAIGLSYYIS